MRSPAESDGEKPSPTPTETVEPTLTPTATATATIASSPTPTATVEPTGGGVSVEEPISEEFPDTVVHVVVVGDTVSALALEYDSTIAAINRANGLNAANLIYTGQRLIVPVNLPETQESASDDQPTATATATATDTPTITPTFTPSPTPTATPVTYQILPGDTLEVIAARYGTTVELLAQQNSIANPHQIGRRSDTGHSNGSATDADSNTDSHIHATPHICGDA